jgi:hypothetical protein
MGAAVGLAIVVLVVGLLARADFRPADVELPWVAGPLAQIAPPTPVPISHPKRPVYRNSVIPGGALNQRELREAVRLDPVVADHYRDFDVTRAHLVRIEAPMAMHVSYRVGDKVYWTREKVWLQPGETLLSDGQNLARGRCGNRVCEVPLGEPAPIEPAPETLDEVLPPSVGIEPLRGFDLLFPLAFVDLPSSPLPQIPEPIVPGPLVVPPQIVPPLTVIEVRIPDPFPPLEPIPEPGTLWLLGSAGVALTLRALRRGPRER